MALTYFLYREISRLESEIHLEYFPYMMGFLVAGFLLQVASWYYTLRANLPNLFKNKKVFSGDLLSSDIYAGKKYFVDIRDLKSIDLNLDNSISDFYEEAAKQFPYQADLPEPDKQLNIQKQETWVHMKYVNRIASYYIAAVDQNEIALFDQARALRLAKELLTVSTVLLILLATAYFIIDLYMS
ncbi:MAG: hypothetical protein ACOCZ8_05375 [Bacteroidota bacterium]